MGKPDTLDRFVQLLIAIAAVFALLNGSFMLADPYGWYQALPTVKFTGPPNQHFIRDIGIAYLTCAILLGYGARYPAGRWMAALAGGLWMSAHSALHIWEVITGVCAQDVFWKDAVGTVGPPLLVWIGLGIMFARQRIAPAGIPRSLMLRVVDHLSPGESQYFHEIAKAPGHAFEKLQNFMPASTHRHDASADVFHMARIGATLIEDCGPCALTAALGAASDGVSRDLVNAALAGNLPDGDLKTAFDFGQSIASQSADALTHGDLIESKYGRIVRLELAMTVAMVRAYPAMKRGLGLTKSCSTTTLKI
jgi:hypothetical protein